MLDRRGKVDARGVSLYQGTRGGCLVGRDCWGPLMDSRRGSTGWSEVGVGKNARLLVQQLLNATFEGCAGFC